MHFELHYHTDDEMWFVHIVMDPDTALSLSVPQFGKGIPNREQDFELLFDDLNIYLEELDQEDQDLIFQLYHDLAESIDTTFANWPVKSYDSEEEDILIKILDTWVVGSAGTIIKSFLEEFDICESLQLYCQENDDIIQLLPDVSNAGMRKHHSEMHTFYEDDLVNLMAVCLLCKFMVPIWAMIEDVVVGYDLEPEVMENVGVDILKSFTWGSVLSVAVQKLDINIAGNLSGKIKSMDRERPDRPPVMQVVEDLNYTRDKVIKFTLYEILSRTMVGFSPTRQERNILSSLRNTSQKRFARRMKQYRDIWDNLSA